MCRLWVLRLVDDHCYCVGFRVDSFWILVLLVSQLSLCRTPSWYILACRVYVGRVNEWELVPSAQSSCAEDVWNIILTTRLIIITALFPCPVRYPDDLWAMRGFDALNRMMREEIA